MALSSSRASLLPLLCFLLAGMAAAANHQHEQSTPASPPVTLAGCPDKCGNVSIPYPFGTKQGCFRPGFFVLCNDTFDPPRPFINSSLFINSSQLAGNDYYDDTRTQIIVEEQYYITSEDGNKTTTEPIWSAWPIQLVGVSLTEGKVRLLGAFSYDCTLNRTHRSVRRQKINFDRGISNELRSPFLLSADDNVLMGIGSQDIAKQTAGPSCMSYIYSNPLPNTPYGVAINGSCSGQGCCQASLIFARSGSKVTTQEKTDVDDGDDDDVPESHSLTVTVQLGNPITVDVSCSYAMIVEKTWYNFSTVDLDSDAFLQRNAAGVVPVVADFTMGIGVGRCPKPNASEPMPKDFACISNNSMCVDRLLASNLTTYYCNCSVGYEGNPYILGGCQDINECAMNPCHGGKCKNTPGDYECSCPPGTRGNAKEAPCSDLFPLPAKISIGVVGGLFIIALLVFIILIRNEKKKMTELFKKNGGPTLEKAKTIKIYKKEELNPILKRSNFIGRGAFGEVYKGFLDNQLVAVKKPIEVNKPTDGNDNVQNDQFANEVIIQSQVIHKNIVKLIGCCLEVDKPMLVYEFLPKGSLDDILHGSNRTSITLECRLNIAAESAEGLAYLHSKTTNVILHGDVKPANILLDDSFTPKISDFGISRLIVIDKEHTDFVIGDRTFMDPVYLRDGLLTDKSDVYSFGVVLLELISRKKATYVDNNSLVRNFLDAHKSQTEATELFDKEIAKPEVLKLLNNLYEIAVNCLNLDVDKRPNMTDVAENLLMLKRSWSNTLTTHVPID